MLDFGQSPHPRSPEPSPGTVFLVGAGPGDPELITVRGLRLLKRAEVLVYDRLVHPDLVAEAPATAERIFAGKRRGIHALRQEDIQALLAEKARQGKTVVRLKGGDPFVFGRGGEEAAELAAAGVPFEVVPAVTSAVAAPAEASIPVTHRGVAASFAVVTGHRMAGAEEPDWTALARIDTVVVLMGLKNLETIARRLVEAGRDPSTPAAVVCKASLAEERVVTATLETIAERVAEADLASPATIVIGNVVELRDTLRSVNPHPAPARIAA